VQYTSKINPEQAGHGVALRRLRQEDCEFEASVGFIGSSRPTCANNNNIHHHNGSEFEMLER
jgi:hypothetical protein